MKKFYQQIKEATDTISVSGNEKQMQSFLLPQYTSLSDEMIWDNLGSLFALKKGQSKDNLSPLKVMVTGHMDQCGFIITEILPHGLLKFLAITPHVTQSLEGRQVTILCKNNQRKTGSILAEKNNYFLDIGCNTHAMVSKLGVQIGDCFILHGDFCILSNQHIMASGLNNKIGAIMTVEILKQLEQYTLPFDLYIGATVQKEVGARGANTCTQKIQPDLAIILDASPSNNATNEENNSTGTLGKGVLTTFYDKGMMPNRSLYHYFTNLCKEKDIPTQPYYSMESNDGGFVHKLVNGCPTLNIGVPARNMHLPTSTLHTQDIIHAIHATLHVLTDLTPTEITLFQKDNR